MKKLTLLFWLCATLAFAQRPVRLSPTPYLVWPGNPASVPVSLSVIGSPISLTVVAKLTPGPASLPLSVQPTTTVSSGVLRVNWTGAQTQALYARSQRVYLDISSGGVTIADLFVDLAYTPLQPISNLVLNLSTLTLPEVTALTTPLAARVSALESKTRLSDFENDMYFISTFPYSGTYSAPVSGTGVGEKGEKGDTGATPTITVGSTTTAPAGSSATVTNTGSNTAVVLNFVIPKGDTGSPGLDGSDGQPGATPTISVVSVSTLAYGATPTVTNVGTPTAVQLAIAWPVGKPGADGTTGPTGASATGGVSLSAANTWTGSNTFASGLQSNGMLTFPSTATALYVDRMIGILSNSLYLAGGSGGVQLWASNAAGGGNLRVTTTAVTMGVSSGTQLQIASGNVQIGTTTVVANRIFDVASTTKFSSPFPKMTATQRDALTGMQGGDFIYNTTTNTLNFYNGTVWKSLLTD